MSETTFTIEGTKLIIERVFNAPKEKIWAAWANATLFEKWWGPRGWSTTVKEHAFENGGTLLYVMKCEDEAQGEWFGQEACGKMVFDEVKPFEGFGYTDYFTDNEGNVNDGMPQVKTTNTLEEVAGGTKFTSIGYYEKPEDLQTVIDMGMEEGIKQTWDRLEELFSGR